MPDTFGSPDAGDVVSRIEKAVNNALGRVEPLFQNASQSFPRAVGSEKVPTTDERAEFVSTIADNPQGVATLLNQWRQQYGDGEALQMLTDYIEKHERWLGRLKPENGRVPPL